MIIKTIEELKQRIGKYVVFSQYDENCEDTCAVLKLVTRIEPRAPWMETFCKGMDSTEIYGWNIWGKYAANFKRVKFVPYLTNDNGESYSNSYAYARDATEKEIKQFRQNWRLAIYKNKIKPNQRYGFKYPHREDYELQF